MFILKLLRPLSTLPLQKFQFPGTRTRSSFAAIVYIWFLCLYLVSGCLWFRRWDEIRNLLRYFLMLFLCLSISLNEVIFKVCCIAIAKCVFCFVLIIDRALLIGWWKRVFWGAIGIGRWKMRVLVFFLTWRTSQPTPTMVFKLPDTLQRCLLLWSPQWKNNCLQKKKIHICLGLQVLLSYAGSYYIYYGNCETQHLDAPIFNLLEVQNWSWLCELWFDWKGDFHFKLGEG